MKAIIALNPKLYKGLGKPDFSSHEFMEQVKADAIQADVEELTEEAETAQWKNKTETTKWKKKNKISLQQILIFFFFTYSDLDLF